MGAAIDATHAVQAGDAIFIPEGWWHQIDSMGDTIAINIWWRSAFDRLLGSHMDSYYLRRALQSLTAAHKAQLLTRPLFPDPAPQHRRDSASLAEATGPGGREEQCSTVRQGVRQHSSESEHKETQPASDFSAAQHGSSANRAKAAADGGLVEERNTKRPRREKNGTRSKEGMV